MGARPGQHTQVEVRFNAEGDDPTRVELEHRDLDRHGPSWDAVHDRAFGDGGWPRYLRRYAALISS